RQRGHWDPGHHVRLRSGFPGCLEETRSGSAEKLSDAVARNTDSGGVLLRWVAVVLGWFPDDLEDRLRDDHRPDVVQHRCLGCQDGCPRHVAAGPLARTLVV